MPPINDRQSLCRQRKIDSFDYRLHIEKLRRIEIKKFRKSSERFITLGESKSQQVIFTLEFMINLLNADSPFPKNFEALFKVKNVWTQHPNRNALKEVKEDLNNIKYRAKNFHDHIRADNLEEVEIFIKNNEALKIAYNINNQCALSTALEFKSVKVHTFLLLQKFSKGIDEKAYEEKYQKLDEDTKIQIRIENSDFFPFLTKNHISQLMCKTRVGFGTQTNFHVKLFDFYMSLDKIEWIHPILQIVASSQDTDIVFDFNHPGVYYLDPTRNLSTRGVCYKSGYILIGAKNANKFEVLGTIAHEFTHYAMQLLYRNKKQPFSVRANANIKRQYENTVQKYKTDERYRNFSLIIDNVFKYNPQFHNEELIVRVPHLLALYHEDQEELRRITHKFKDLFKFYKAFVLEDLLLEASVIHARRKLQETNKDLHVLSTIQKRCSLCPNYVPKIKVGMKVFIKSPLPALVLESLINELKKKEERIDTSHVFVNLEQLSDNENLDMLKNAAKSKVKPTFYIIESSNHKLNGIQDELKCALQNRKIVFISRIQNTEFEKLFQNIEKFELKIRWNDLNDDYQFRILKSRVIFQDLEVVLGEVIRNCSWLQEVPLEEVFYSSTMTFQSFSKTLPEKPSVHIDQQILNSNFVDFDRSLGLGELLGKQKTILISDYAGRGKTTFAVEIARKLKLRNQLFWVLFIDLKWHTKSFLEDKQLQPETIKPTFFSRKLLRLESTFEQKLFEYLYKTRRVIFIFDGFDEISPDYKNFVINLLKAVRDGGNQLLVTTRPHVQKELTKKLDTKTIFHLEPFGIENQVEFFAKFFQQSGDNRLDHSEVVDGDPVSNLEVRVGKWLEEVRKIFGDDGSDFLNVPIHNIMLAETVQSMNLENFATMQWNVFKLYERFVEKKIEIWIQRGPLAANDNRNLQLQSPTTLTRIFQTLAIKKLFQNTNLTDISLPKVSKRDIHQLIKRVGIIAYGSGRKFEFVHKTFAEYFAAEFIMNCSDQTPNIVNFKLFVEALGKDNLGQVRKFMSDRVQILESTVEPGTTEVEEIKKFVKQNEEAIENEQDESLHNKLSRESFVYYVILGRLTNLLIFILETLELGFETKIKIVKRFLYKAVENFHSFVIIWDYIGKLSQSGHLEALEKEFLMHRFGRKKGNMFLNAIECHGDRKSDSVSRKILDIAKETLDEQEFLSFLIHDEHENGEYPLRSALKCDISTFRLIWRTASEKFRNIKNLKKIMNKKDLFGKTILHFLSFRGKELLEWIEKVKIYSQELSTLMSYQDKGKEMFIHNAVRNLTREEFLSLWELIGQHGKKKQQKLLFHKNFENRVLFDFAVDNNDSSVFHCIFDITRSMLQSKRKNIIQFLCERNFFSEFIKVAEEISRENQLSEFVGDKTTFLKSAFFVLQNLAENEAENMWRQIAGRIAYPQKIEKAFFENDSFTVIIHCAAGNGNRTFMDMLKWCRKNLGNVLKKIFYTQNISNQNRTLLHVVAEKCNESDTRKCYDFVARNLTKEDRRIIFSLKDQDGMVPLKALFKNKHLGVMKIILKHYKELFNNDVIMKFLGEKPPNLASSIENRRLIDMILYLNS